MYTLAITHPTTICCILPIANNACNGDLKAHTGFKIAGANFHKYDDNKRICYGIHHFSYDAF